MSIAKAPEASSARGRAAGPIQAEVRAGQQSKQRRMESDSMPVSYTTGAVLAVSSGNKRTAYLFYKKNDNLTLSFVVESDGEMTRISGDSVG